MRFFRKAGQIDPAPLLADLAAHPELWGRNGIRTAWEDSPHHEATDILLRFVDLSGADFVERATTLKRVWCDTPTLAALPSLGEMLDDICDVIAVGRDLAGLGSVIVAKLPPGGRIKPHSDRNEAAEKMFPHRPVPCLWYDRYQVVLQGEQRFRSGDEAVTMIAGEVWWFDNAAEHEVLACGAVDRISLIVDVRSSAPMPRVNDPNEWPGVFERLEA